MAGKKRSLIVVDLSKVEGVYVGTGELGAICGRDPQTLIRWARTGRLPPPTARTVGQHYRWRVDSLEEWLTSEAAASAGFSLPPSARPKSLGRSPGPSASATVVSLADLHARVSRLEALVRGTIFASVGASAGDRQAAYSSLAPRPHEPVSPAARYTPGASLRDRHRRRSADHLDWPSDRGRAASGNDSSRADAVARAKDLLKRYGR